MTHIETIMPQEQQENSAMTVSITILQQKESGILAEMSYLVLGHKTWVWRIVLLKKNQEVLTYAKET